MSNPVKELLTRRVDEVIEKDHLTRALNSTKRLRIKFGIDPTSSKMHLGHTVPLLKLKEFQNLGHWVILVIGDTTATIGDPSGRQVSRKVLTQEEVKENMKAYERQISKVLDPKKTEFVYNSTWFKKMGISDLMKMASSATLQQVRKRREFKERIEKGEDISLTEILYPVMQGYDSVQVKADVEIGGTDQKFNLLMGRQIQKRFGQEEQDVITVPLLIGTDGKKKMSKTAGNYIALDDKPNEMFAKIMSIPDELILNYFELCTEGPSNEIKTIKRQVVSDPMGTKKRLALEITQMYHGREKSKRAQEEFVKVFSKEGIPDDAPTWKLSGKTVNLPNLLVERKIEDSKSEVRRLIKQGGISLNGEKVMDIKIKFEKGVLRIGKKTFIKIK